VTPSFRARHIVPGCQRDSVRRRTVLAGTAALLGPGLAGCLGGSTPTDSTPSGSTTSDSNRSGSDTTRNSPQPDYSLSVDFERLQPAVVVLAEDGPRVLGEGHQYLFCRVDATDGDHPDRLSFAFRLGGNVYSPGVESAGRLWRAEGEGSRYDADSGRGWLVFELPEAWRAVHAALSLRGNEWPVGESIRERLSATPPSLSVDWRVASTDSAGDASFAFEVANDSEYDSRFVAALTEVGEDGGDSGDDEDGEESLLGVVNEQIPSGETVSWTETWAGGGDEGAEGNDRTFALSWVGGRLTGSL
jgi:hypothetical protein